MIHNTNLIIELYVLCYNEEKIIVHTLNYYSQFCNKIIVIDNQSTDQSIALATQFKNVEVRTLPSNNQFIEDVLTTSRNNCWKGSKADFVIVCDMDELLYDENLIQKLESAKHHHISIPKINGYNMMSENFPDDYSQLITNQVKQGIRTTRFDKKIIFDPKNVKEINYRPGAHLCYPVFYQSPPATPTIELALLHYKYLGKDYLYQKHQRYADRMSTTSKEKKHGAEYLEGQTHINKMFEQATQLEKIIR